MKRVALPKSIHRRVDRPPGVNFGVYVNVLGIIVLVEPNDHFSDVQFQEGPETFGVDDIRTDLPGEDADENEGGEEYLSRGNTCTKAERRTCAWSPLRGRDIFESLC